MRRRRILVLCAVASFVAAGIGITTLQDGVYGYSTQYPPTAWTTPQFYDFWTHTQLEPMSEASLQEICALTDAQREASMQAQLAEAHAISDRLEAYIRAWLAGQVPAELPAGLLPPSIDNEKTTGWVLKRPDEVDPADQWGIRPANDIPRDFSDLHFLGPDNHVTYMQSYFVAPFGTEMLIEGEFPHARFMSYQILEPFDPWNPTTAGMGAPEVPIVDVDIDPDPGHVNPFRPGADRNATNRRYHVTFDLEAGNAVDLNPLAMLAPAYRAPGNRRVGGPFGAAGPIGNNAIIASILWLRYYAPDKAVGPLGGVPLPKLMFRLDTGEEFWLQADFSLAEERGNWTVSGTVTWPQEPPSMLGGSVGWGKMWGFWLTFADGIGYPVSYPWGFIPKWKVGDWIKERHECLFNRGPGLSAPGNHELSASGCNHVSYLYRVMMLGWDKVYVLRGKLPRTPRTREGEPVAGTAEARYFSICHTGDGPGGKYPSLLYGCLMDDEIKVDKDGNYMIVYSRGDDRPWNASEQCGVTWQDYGPETKQAFTLRWMSVMPEDHLPEYAPHMDNLPWETSEWSERTWQRDLTSRNDHQGALGPYQPVVHYMPQYIFERLGCPVSPASIPKWVW